MKTQITYTFDEEDYEAMQILLDHRKNWRVIEDLKNQFRMMRKHGNAEDSSFGERAESILYEIINEQ